MPEVKSSGSVGAGYLPAAAPDPQDKLYPIRNGPVTVYVRRKYGGEEFEFKGLVVDGDDSYYAPYADIGSRIQLDDGEHPCVGLYSFLKDVYKAMADAELAAYLEVHIRDWSIYLCDSRDTPRVWYSAGQFPEHRRHTNLVLERGVNGIIGYELDHVVCLYDLVSKKHVGFKSGHNDKDTQITPMEVFYGLYLDQLLALEQHKRGTAPPAYAELARLAAFLEGKKSVKLVMKDGGVHELKPHNGCDVSLSRLLSIVPGNETAPFLLCDDYDLRPRFGRCRRLADLDYLQHGKHRFVIDAAALESTGGPAPENGAA